MAYGENGLSASDIALLNGSGRNNDGGFGDGAGAWWVIIFLIFAFLGWGGNGNRGFGGGYNGGGTYENYTLVSDFSQLSRQLADSAAMTERKLDGVNNGLCSGFYQEAQLINGVNSNIASSTASIQNTLTQGFAGLNTALVQNGYETINAVNSVGTQLASCCCDLKGQLKDNRYENAQNINALNNNMTAGFTSTQNAMCLNTRDIISSQENGTKAILDAITQNRIEDKNAQIALLQNQLNKAELSASQSAQNQYLINQLKPCPIPAFITCNPWGCNCGNVATANAGCNCGNY